VADAISAARATSAADNARLAAHRRALAEATVLRGSGLKTQGSS
jgi:hypothetical protein